MENASVRHAQPRLTRLLRHRWADLSQVLNVLDREALARLTAYIGAAEARHGGQIRLCIEAGLPTSYVWKGLTARDRALTLFGKFRIWDTEARNGVLIYLLLTEHAIEIVADRGLTPHVTPDAWQAMQARMATAFREGRFEAGLRDAIDEVSATLTRAFPAPADAAAGVHRNELPDEPIVL